MVCFGKDHTDHMVETIKKALSHVIPRRKRKQKKKKKGISHVINQAEALKKECEKLEAKIDARCKKIIKQAHDDCKRAY